MISYHTEDNSKQDTYIIHDGICLGHQSSDSRCMHDFSVRTREARPERPDMHFELVKAIGPYALKKRIQMVLEPGPDLTGGNALRRRRVCS
jgi:hypothetical protein